MIDIVQDGSVVSLAYELRLKSGEVVDYSDDNDPLEYLHGASNLIPGLETELNGLRVGDSKDVEVQPADAYGEYDPEEVQVIVRKLLPKDIEFRLGMHLAISDEDGNMSEAFEREIGPNSVTLDFNHELAGETLFFSVKVLGVREATEEEIAHGHAHGEHGHEDDDFEDDDDDDFEDDDEFEDFEDEDDSAPLN